MLDFEMGHTTPGFTLGVYAAAMKAGAGDRERLRLLVEGSEDWKVSEPEKVAGRGV